MYNKHIVTSASSMGKGRDEQGKTTLTFPREQNPHLFGPRPEQSGLGAERIADTNPISSESEPGKSFSTPSFHVLGDRLGHGLTILEASRPNTAL